MAERSNNTDRLCRENFSAGTHYLSQTNVEVDISSPHSHNKISVYHPTSAFYPTQVPTYFMNVEIETVFGACGLHRFNGNYREGSNLGFPIELKNKLGTCRGH